jgi:ABC-type transporter Mla subunit MlaD
MNDPKRKKYFLLLLLLVLGTVALLVGIAFWHANTDSYVVYILFRDSVPVRVGCPVKKYGLNAGSVHHVTTARDGQILVTARVYAEYRIMSKSACFFVPQDENGDAFIAIDVTVVGTLPGQYISSGATIEGVLADTVSSRLLRRWNKRPSFW